MPVARRAVLERDDRRPRELHSLSSMDATIEVTGLRKHFGPTVAVDGLTFRVEPGQITGFVGPNGAGKSTTMRVVLGLDSADEGSALIGGQPYASLRHPLSHVGALLDAGALQPSRKARDHLLWLAHSQGLGRAARHRGDRPDGHRPGGPPQGGRLLTRHAAAARDRGRDAGRSAGADVRRAVQRPGPGGNGVDARLPAVHGRRRTSRAGVEPPDERAPGQRRPPARHRPRPDGRRHQRRGPAGGRIEGPGDGPHDGTQRGNDGARAGWRHRGGLRSRPAGRVRA